MKGFGMTQANDRVSRSELDLHIVVVLPGGR